MTRLKGSVQKPYCSLRESVWLTVPCIIWSCDDHEVKGGDRGDEVKEEEEKEEKMREEAADKEKM